MHPSIRSSLVKYLLICGILASLLYIGTDTLLAMNYPGYSYINQSISELSAIGTPTRTLWIAMSFLFNPLLIAFGLGVWKIARKRSLQVTGMLLAIWGALGFAWLFFPMHLPGSIGSTTDTMHLVMAGITVFLMTLFISIGSVTQGKLFRLYSILTIATMLIFGFLVSIQAPSVAAQLPTPFMGVMERISVYSPMFWMAILAITLLRNENAAECGQLKKHRVASLNGAQFIS